jgi:uncharacterized coiled-coil DUF342 family protein
MADNNDILKAIESIQSDVGNIKKDMATKSDLETVKNDLQDVKQAQAQTNKRVDDLATGQAQIHTSLAQNTTLLEAVAAGQKELKEIVATKADHLDLSRKIDKAIKDYGERNEDLEKIENIPHPHKH